METVFIADDELNIREGLKHIIDWQSLGFEIIDEASNGEATLEAVLEKQPSLVLLDIHMPKKYGTQIVQEAREKGYKGRFIILSGYSDFTYAQTAIKYDVTDYLTKPIDEDELLEAVIRTKEIIEKAKNKELHDRIFREKARSSIFHEIIMGTWNPDENNLTEKEIHEMLLDADRYQVVIYEDFSQNQEEKYDFAELMKATDNENSGIEHLREDGNDIIILKGNHSLDRFGHFIDRYEFTVPQDKSPLDSIFIAYGRPVSHPDEIYISYEEAVNLCRRRYFCEQGQHTIGFYALPDLQKGLEILTESKAEEVSEKLSDYLLAYNRNMMAETMKELASYIYNSDGDIDEVKHFMIDLYTKMRGKTVFKSQNQNPGFDSSADAVKIINESHYLFEAIRYITEQINKVMDSMSGQTRDTILEDVIYYIDHNYQNNLKLEAIAPLFGYSSTHLGRLFSQNIGENFNSYVDGKRIEKSKEMLEEGRLKVYEISQKLGYGNVDYFHKKFKKYVGLSPVEYRKKCEESGTGEMD